MIAQDQMFAVNQVLDLYIACHNEIFGFSLRKVIPIPGIFKATNHGELVVALALVKSELRKINPDLEPGAYREELRAFVNDFIENASGLMEISGRLLSKSSSDPKWVREYPLSEYNSDVDRYFKLVEKRVDSGAKLNKAFRARAKAS